MNADNRSYVKSDVGRRADSASAIEPRVTDSHATRHATGGKLLSFISIFLGTVRTLQRPGSVDCGGL